MCCVVCQLQHVHLRSCWCFVHAQLLRCRRPRPQLVHESVRRIRHDRRLHVLFWAQDQLQEVRLRRHQGDLRARLDVRRQQVPAAHLDAAAAGSARWHSDVPSHWWFMLRWWRVVLDWSGLRQERVRGRGDVRQRRQRPVCVEPVQVWRKVRRGEEVLHHDSVPAVPLRQADCVRRQAVRGGRVLRGRSQELHHAAVPAVQVHEGEEVRL